MSLFKYMTIDAARAYFSNSMLRASKPEEFNDVLDAYPVLPDVPASEIEEKARARTDKRIADGAPITSAHPDPYEGTLHYELWVGNREAREEKPTFNELYRQLLFRFICFCRSGRHPLMWTHYARDHQGIQLEFDEQHECFSGKLRNVVYVEERPVLSLTEMREIVARFRDPNLVAPSFFFHKALEWSYEQEVRMFVKPDETVPFAMDKGNPIHLYRIPFAALRSITFGSRSWIAERELRDLINSVVQNEGLDIKAYQLRTSATEYKLEKHEMKLFSRKP